MSRLFSSSAVSALLSCEFIAGCEDSLDLILVPKLCLGMTLSWKLCFSCLQRNRVSRASAFPNRVWEREQAHTLSHPCYQRHPRFKTSVAVEPLWVIRGQ